MKGQRLNHVFFISGLVLAASEIWKQWCLTVRVNGGVYDWWYFPFQLCSLPMYLLLVFPWVKSRKMRRALLAFLMDYTLLGSIMVWAEPSGLFYPLAALTLHSFLWHILLTVIGLLAGFSWRSETKTSSCGGFTLMETAGVSWRQAAREAGKDFLDATLLYGAGCLAAAFLNFLFREKGEINMFYINPDAPVTQPFFRHLVPVIGQVPTILLYMLATVAGAGILHKIWGVKHSS